MATGEAPGLAGQGRPTMRQRAVPRVQPTEHLDANVTAVQSARIVDISSRGAQIEVAYSLPPSGRCDLRIQFADGEFAAHATIRRCQAAGLGIDGENQPIVLYRAGLEFDELAPECLAWLSSNVLFQSGT
jgi:hypothetical protein